MAQSVKKPPAMQKTWVQSLGWEDPLEKGKATHSSILASSPWGRKESDTTERLIWSEVKVKVTQSCLTLCDPMDYIVHGILQARILEWVAFPFSRGTSQPHNQTRASCIAGGFFTNWAIRELKKEEKERKRRGRRIQKGEFCRPWHEILYLRQDSLFDVFQATLPAFICAVPAPLCHSDSLKPV